MAYQALWIGSLREWFPTKALKQKPYLILRAAVRNIGQWSQDWTS